jgi:Tfp pilus assembly protein PilF
MRFLSRISAWLKAGPRTRDIVEPRPQEALERGVDPALLARMPSAPMEPFRSRLLAAVAAAHADERAVLATLDPSVEVLVVPRADNMSSARDRRLSAEIDEALRRIEAGGRSYSSLTWSALRDARPPFSPPAHEWAAELAHRFEGDAGIIFFVDVEAVAIAMCHAADAQGLTARVDDDAQTVRVSDGRFEAHVGTSALIAEALWTGRGPLSVISRRATNLPSELRSFLSLLRGLERRFEGVRFTVRPEAIVAHRDKGTLSLDYRHLSAAWRATGLSCDGWLARAHIEDLLGDGGDLGVLVRSPAYLRAFPDALAQPGTDHVLVAVRLADGAASAVKRRPDDHPERFQHYRDEATRQLPFFSFDGHGFVVEQGTRKGVARAVCLVGDKAASVAFHPSLVKGLLEQLVPREPRVRVRSFSEDTVCFASVHASEELLEETKKRAHQLEGDLCPDGSDPLVFDREIDLPEVGHGHFELTLVPEAYFNVRDQAHTRSDLGRGHTDYLRGLSFELLGRPDLAVNAFERAVRASSADGEMNLALGRTLCSLEEHSRAVTFLEKAAGALPEHPEAVNALGVALYRSGDPAHARSAFQRAVKLAPDEVGFLVNLGRTCCDEKLYGEARAALEHALRVEPTSAEAHASMAVLCHRTGERTRALHHAREALAEHPDDETVRELLRMLDEEP